MLKEQEEYERRKRAVEVELRKQYEDIINENKRVADMRSQKVKEEEEKERELMEAEKNGSDEVESAQSEEEKMDVDELGAKAEEIEEEEKDDELSAIPQKNDEHA